MVNVAYDAPVDFRRASRSRRPSAGSTSSPRTAATTAASRSFSPALTVAIDMAAAAYKRDGKLSGISTGLRDLDAQHGRPAALRPYHPRRPPRHGQDLARHQHRLQHRATPSSGELAADGTHEDRQRRHRRLLLAAKCRPSSSPPVSSPSTPASPSSTIRRGGITEADFEKIRDAAIEMQSPAVLRRPDRRPLHRASSPRARAGCKRQKGLDLLIIDYIQLLSGSVEAPSTTACRRSPRSPPT